MARSSEHPTGGIYAAVEKWKNTSLFTSDSLLWPESKIWTLENLDAFNIVFGKNPKTSDESFLVKFKEQMKDAEPDTLKLAVELLLIYYMFPASITQGRKRRVLAFVSSWKELTIPDAERSLEFLKTGIGNAGQAYNTRMPFELAYLAEAVRRLLQRDPAERKVLLIEHLKFREFLDAIDGKTILEGSGRNFQMTDILPHLIFPDIYERMASGGHKSWIADAFSSLLENEDSPDQIDDKLLAIRSKLEALLPGKVLDFYKSPLRECWLGSSSGSGDGYAFEESEDIRFLDEGPEDDLSPLDALGFKKQIVLYGPPGTGKTYEARVTLAEQLVRRGVLKSRKPKWYFENALAVEVIVKQRAMRIQLHPGYGYEDLIRGLQIGANNATVYKDGVLRTLIKTLDAESDDEKQIPFVLILDEMNRADLSKVLGECFSALEDRGKPVTLASQDGNSEPLTVPGNLYIIGTMNLIDQSLEQVDFALRRRFLWFFRGFSPREFLSLSKYRWEAQQQIKNSGIKKDWDRYSSDFLELARRATTLNKFISASEHLNENYQIGHTYFCDIVEFAKRLLIRIPDAKYLLFDGRKRARGPVEMLWKFSLKPLLEQYLSGLDSAERTEFLKTAEHIMLDGNGK